VLIITLALKFGKGVKTGLSTPQILQGDGGKKRERKKVTGMGGQRRQEGGRALRKFHGHADQVIRLCSLWWQSWWLVTCSYSCLEPSAAAAAPSADAEYALSLLNGESFSFAASRPETM